MPKLPTDIITIREEFEDIFYSLDERRIRIWCASKARAYNRTHGRGGVTAVYRATNVSRPRIYYGLKEIECEDKLEKDRVRKSGGGRKKLTEKQVTILKDLELLLEPSSRGDPESPLRWTCKSTYNLRDELIAQGYDMGRVEYHNVRELLITADCGGSNGYRVRLWKVELQRFANETGLTINVCHFPPGTSKWNKIEHKMFSFISKNWRGRPLISRETIVNLIGNTKTKTGLKIKVKLDENIYKKGRKITDKELENLYIEKSNFHGEWNYKIKPKN